MIAIFLRGATAWEVQLGLRCCSLWLHLRYPGYWRSCGPGFIRILGKDEE